ncbi:BrnT family toxin [Leptospira wolffii]|uniref:BrnT family toxin n=1 Tax=Leptospira wolffii TaxID=409998 RepID=UPI001082CD13|nr:BrnT family toxin [Leptospira wolffii]TGK58285.1 BrnT family toxin [Leptospira wolffii]TGK66338.1 BrnT family toxin [Leptospira wolffii]TGK68963.1 BrnT family toxin [Leptospira wolffii]TGL27315.1 BrnT family toxin [Leptospira wolffii]
MDLPDFSLITGFDWDAGNIEKNWKKHKVKPGEIEEIFFNDPLIVVPDDYHSGKEDRYIILGVTNAGRKLFAVTTFRGDKIRPISARDMTPRERKIYESS